MLYPLQKWCIDISQQLSDSQRSTTHMRTHGTVINKHNKYFFLYLWKLILVIKKNVKKCVEYIELNVMLY